MQESDYIFDTRSVFSLNRTIIFSVPQAFARLSIMASSGVRENVHLNTKLELCWNTALQYSRFTDISVVG